MTDLATLLDERAITAQLTAYCRSMDRCDHALGYGVFHDDAVLDYGVMYQGGARGFVDATLKAHLSLESHLHRISNITIAVNGDRAGSETYVEGIFRGVAQGAPFEMRTCGRYVDQWEKRGGRWAISKRIYVHTTDSMKSGETPRYAVGGARDDSDPSYVALKP